MLVWSLLAAALLLSIERVSYVWICRDPERFGALSTRLAGSPIDGLRCLFYVFKVLQIVVFLGWCVAAGGGIRPTGGPVAVLVGLLLIAVGQVLNAGVFYRLGTLGVFYGNKFGHSLPWQRAFPFSLLEHPQYVGTVLSIWGFFLIVRFPNADWAVLPMLESVYYYFGARFER